MSRAWSALAANPFLARVSWLGGAEAVHRLSRILTAVILARQLDAEAFGWAALALTIFELTRVFTNNGLGQSVIRADQSQLAAVSRSVHRLGWAVCLGLLLVQGLTAVTLALWHQRPDLGWMIGALALVYLILPLGLVSAAHILRQNNMRAIAKISAGQALADNLLTAGLALAGCGAWAIVLPKLLTAPLWLWGIWRVHHWRPSGQQVEPVSLDSLWQYCRPVLGSELLATARMHADKLIIGACLGVEALGVYYFAYHAGVGFSLSLTGAFSTAVFPHLAAAATQQGLQQALAQSLRGAGLLICAAIAAQAACASFYVPWVFGGEWAHASNLVAILCVSAVFKVLGDAATQVWRVQGQPQVDLRASLLFTLLSLGGLWWVASFGLVMATLYLAVLACVFYPLYMLWTWQQLRRDNGLMAQVTPA